MSGVKYGGATSIARVSGGGGGGGGGGGVSSVGRALDSW